MSEPIYKLFLIRGLREAYYQLSSEERDRYWQQVGDSGKALGVKTLLACDSRWCDESLQFWGLEEYPDLQTVQRHVQALDKIQHWRYLDSQTILGTRRANIPLSQPDFSQSRYQLFLLKNHDNDAWLSLPKDERDRLFSQVTDSIRDHGGVFIIGCDCDWSNEEYANFGITAWPSLEAEQAHFRDLEKINWHRYVYARTILGTRA